MTQPDNIILVSPWIACAIIGLIITWPLYLLCKKRWYPTSSNDRDTTPPDWSTAPGSAEKKRSSFFHTWDPRVKIATLFAFCFVVVSLDALGTCLAALLISILAVFFSHTPWIRVQKRLVALSGFLTMFLVIMPFTSPAVEQETILLFPLLSTLPFHMYGLLTAVLICLKACSVALLMEPMFGTSSLTISLQALQQIGVPSPIIQMLLLTHRFIYLFQQEAHRMHRSMKLRGFSPKTNMATMCITGNFLGMLFIRSYERTQHVYEAMLSRGYNGIFPIYTQHRISAKDIAITGAWLITGLALLLFDAPAQALWL